VTQTVAGPDDPRSVYGITRPDRNLLWVYVLRTVAICFLGPWFCVVLVPFYFKYKTLAYHFDGEGVKMAWGLLWRREIYLTYARIQDIHLSRGVLERWLGVATIQVQTASGSSAAEMSLVGITEYELVRDFLYSRMRGAQTADDGVGPSGPERSDELLPVLIESRVEIRSRRGALSREQP
jgi:putative membrane protein